MLIFMAIAVAAFIIVAGSFLFGHDHEADSGADHGDTGDDGGGMGGEPTISVFSTKVLGTLVMGFGAAGALARNSGLDYPAASGIGLGSGLVLGGVMYAVLGLFYKQQASSLVPTTSAVGCLGTVTTGIGENSLGEVGVTLNGQYTIFTANSLDGRPLNKGQSVRVVRTLGSQLVVEKTT